MDRRVAVVTGAGQGLGEAIARRLAADGCKVIALDVDDDRAATVAADIDGRFLHCDVADPDAVRAAAEAVGPTDILVNNAGIWFTEPTLDAIDEHLQAVVAVDILGVLYCSKAFVPSMIREGPDRSSISPRALPSPTVPVMGSTRHPRPRSSR